MPRNSRTSKNLIKVLKDDGLAVIPTDTIYGIAALAHSKKAVEQVYKIMKRNPKKPFIILISSIKDLKKFNIKLDKNTENILKQIWPGKVSVILPVISPKFQYLHRGTNTLAFRVPKKKNLLNLIKKTGPLISTSANPQGQRPAQTIAEARKYFGDKIDFYINEGKIKSFPSTLVEIKNGNVRVIRKGALKIPRVLLKNNQ